MLMKAGLSAGSDIYTRCVHACCSLVELMIVARLFTTLVLIDVGLC